MKKVVQTHFNILDIVEKFSLTSKSVEKLLRRYEFIRSWKTAFKHT